RPASDWRSIRSRNWARCWHWHSRTCATARASCFSVTRTPATSCHSAVGSGTEEGRGEKGEGRGERGKGKGEKGKGERGDGHPERSGPQGREVEGSASIKQQTPPLAPTALGWDDPFPSPFSRPPFPLSPFPSPVPRLPSPLSPL